MSDAEQMHRELAEFRTQLEGLTAWLSHLQAKELFDKLEKFERRFDDQLQQWKEDRNAIEERLDILETGEEID